MSHKSNSNTEEVMKELEKIAFKKGWIKPELQKQASLEQVKKDYTPTNNKDGDIIKLCAGLRDKGFHIEADVLEDNFLAFKKAENLYNIKIKSYEDYFKDAHPKSAEIAGYEVHDIYDVQESMLKAVEQKKKKSKLAAIASLFKYATLSEDKKILSQHLVGIAQIIRSMGSLISTDSSSSDSSKAADVALSCSKKADEIISFAKSGTITLSSLYEIKSFENKLKSDWYNNWFDANDLSSDGRALYDKLKSEFTHRIDWCESIVKKIESESLTKTDDEVKQDKEDSKINSNNLVRLSALKKRYLAFKNAIEGDAEMKSPPWDKDYNNVIQPSYTLITSRLEELDRYLNSNQPVNQKKIDSKFSYLEGVLVKLENAYL
jgi:hypothetical protein